MRSSLFFHNAFDELVLEARAVITAKLDHYAWIPKEDLIRFIAKQLNVSWETAERIFLDLYRLKVLEANYGFFKMRGGDRPPITG